MKKWRIFKVNCRGGRVVELPNKAVIIKVDWYMTGDFRLTYAEPVEVESRKTKVK